jgi:hypothetical protein
LKGIHRLAPIDAAFQRANANPLVAAAWKITPTLNLEQQFDRVIGAADQAIHPND